MNDDAQKPRKTQSSMHKVKTHEVEKEMRIGEGPLICIVKLCSWPRMVGFRVEATRDTAAEAGGKGGWPIAAKRRVDVGGRWEEGGCV